MAKITVSFQKVDAYTYGRDDCARCIAEHC